MGFWQKLAQGIGIGVQMTAPVAPIVGGIELQATLKVIEAVLAGTQAAKQPEKAIEAAFQALGVTLQSYELLILASLAQRVKAATTVASDK